jgi:hypothetical protein
VPAHEADPDRDESRLVRGRVDVHRFQVADLVAVRVDDFLATPVAQILRWEHVP